MLFVVVEIGSTAPPFLGVKATSLSVPRSRSLSTLCVVGIQVQRHALFSRRIFPEQSADFLICFLIWWIFTKDTAVAAWVHRSLSVRGDNRFLLHSILWANNGANVFFMSSLPSSLQPLNSSVWLLPVISLLLTNTVSRVRACLSIWLERFCGSQTKRWRAWASCMLIPRWFDGRIHR
jgi:hypothetical protein